MDHVSSFVLANLTLSKFSAVSLQESLWPSGAVPASPGVLAICTAEPPLLEEWRVVAVYDAYDLYASTEPLLQMWQHYVRPVFALTAPIDDAASRRRAMDAVARFAAFDEKPQG